MSMIAPSRLALAALLAAMTTPALAQNTPPDLPSVISPLKSEPDPNGVNIVDGKKIVEMPVVLSIPADPRLTFDRVQNAAPYILGTISHNQPDQPLASSWSAHYGEERSESFQCENDDVCHSVTYSGSNITYASRSVRQAGTGVFYAFNKLQSRVDNGTSTQEQRYASSVQYPDGEVISYTYEEGFQTGNPYPSCPSAGNCLSYYRPTRVSSNSGYYITISYQYTGTDVGNSLWGSPAQAAIYSPSNVLIRRLVYSGGTITDYGNNPANSGGRTFTTGGVANALGSQLETNNASVTLPGEGPTQISIVGTSSHGSNTVDPLIDSVTRDGVPWTYTYANARRDTTVDVPLTTVLRYDSLTVAGPNGYNVTYTMFPNSYFVTPKNNHNLIQSRTDALGRTTGFAYGDGDRLTGITMPEGNSVTLLYDECGNVVSKTSVAKAGSGLANLVESAAYPASGLPENPCPTVLNYRSTSYTDALGRVTSYTYNANGQMTQELAPADASGVRRETDITYAASPSGLSRKTLVRVCGATTTCPGNAESHTEYTYVGDTDLPLTVTQKDEATAQTRTTAYTYDAAGRPTAIDGPLAGTGDARYFQYDTYGRKVWEVGELAPNGKRLAKKFTYRNSDDKVTIVETGTVICASGCNTASLALTLLQQTDTTYDSRRYPIREKTYKGTTTYSVTDRSFLDRGLNDCTTVRMNLASLPTATATSACSLGTQGTAGPDRITKNIYDSAGQLTKVQKAYLTADQADYATYTYTPNGKQDYVTDANGNKARFVYDGFDRLSQWQFPSKTTAGTVNTADYEQYGYDAGGNRTCLRKRDGSKLTFTYDGLNRMLSKVVAATSGGVCP